MKLKHLSDAVELADALQRLLEFRETFVKENPDDSEAYEVSVSTGRDLVVDVWFAAGKILEAIDIEIAECKRDLHALGVEV